MHAVADLLSAEIEALKRLVALMSEEQDALKAAQAESLPALSQTKIELIGELNALELQRNAGIGAPLGVDPKKAMQDWLAQHAADSGLKIRWDEVLNLAQEAKNLNQINGKLLALHLTRTSEALDVLTIRQAGSSLYGSNGQTNPLTGSRIIDSA